MPLHPQVKVLLEILDATGAPPLSSQTPADARAAYREMARMKPPGGAVIAGARDLDIPGADGRIPLRVYTPRGAPPFPLLVFFHGGGFVIGDLDTHDAGCRELCAGAGCVVVAVDYRLAPEHKFPAAVDDCLAATRWVGAHAAELRGDPSRIAVGGDSAGGNLATVVALRSRDEGGPRLCAQLLIYPVTDHYSRSTVSMRENADGYLLTLDSMVWFADHYLRDAADIGHPHAVPLRAATLHGLPPAWVGTAEFDPLRDEGEAYAARLAAAGVPTTARRYDGAIHGFLSFFAVLDLGRQIMNDCCDWLRVRFANTSVPGTGD
ncbi:MAG: alpha/beta hydrolase [Gammaproteobacteria bacterium]|nr:alpha/beta hydrolase [Gammaproteobacteria bacterium]